MKKNYRKTLARGFFIFIFLSGVLFVKFKNKTPNQDLQIIEEENFHELTFKEKKERVLNLLENNNIQHPEIVLAQAILESGNFRSKIFRDNNNMFGMRLPERRETVAVGKHKGYAVYESWEDSIKDYSLYQQSILRGKILSRDEYLNFLGRRYAEHPEYVSVLKKMVN